MNNQAILDGIDDLTPQWLSAVLGTQVKSLAIERIGTGQTAATYRLVIDADRSPATLVAKVPAGDAEARRRVRDGFRKEIGFYTELAGSVSVRAPGCWHAAISQDGASFALLLEDLSHYSPGAQVAGCPMEQIGAAIDNLARLHAPRWNDETLYDLRFLRRFTAEGATFLKNVTVSSTETFIGRYAADL